IGGVGVPDVTATFLLMSVSARARRAAVRIIGSAPKPVKRAACGRPERRDGLVLHPDMQAMLALMRLDDVDPGAASFSKQRRDMAASDRLVGGNQPIGAVTDRQ